MDDQSKNKEASENGFNVANDSEATCDSNKRKIRNDCTNLLLQNKKLKYGAKEGNDDNDDNSDDKEIPSKDDASNEDDAKMTKDEKRMEINRLRAKEIRKQKKKMEADMGKQVVQLTLEHNKLKNQIKMQQTELELLRNFANMPRMMNNPIVLNQDLSNLVALQPPFHKSMALNTMALPQLNGINPSLLSSNNGIGSFATAPQSRMNEYSLLPMSGNTLATQPNHSTGNVTDSKQDINEIGNVKNKDHQTQYLNSDNTFDDYDDMMKQHQQIANIFSNCTPSVQQSLLQSLQTEGNNTGRDQIGHTW